MSFTAPRPAPARLNRSELAVPGNRPDLFAKAAAGPADVVFLDLEDSVSPSEKPAARENVIEAIGAHDWGERSLSVRINGLDTPYMYRDLVDLLERAGDRLDLIMIPKVGVAADIYTVDCLATQIEAATGRAKQIGFELIIESAQGLANIDAIAAASTRNESLHFGVADYAAATQAKTTTIGGANPDYGVLTDSDEQGARAFHWGDMWHYPMARLVVAARANGLRPVDGPYGDFQDRAGFAAQARRAMALGFSGKWAIHPSQISDANTVFTPDEAAVAQARRILSAMADARAAGRGAVTLDGKMIDAASIRQAEVMVATADQIARREDGSG